MAAAMFEAVFPLVPGDSGGSVLVSMMKAPDHQVGIWWEKIRPACRYKAERTVRAADDELTLSSRLLL